MPDSSFSRSNEVSVFGRTDFRDRNVAFGIRRKDRREHIYILGKTGTGKSNLLETLMLDDARKGYGFALLDPHGDLATRILRLLPRERAGDVIDLDVANPRQPYGFNPLANVPPGRRALACSGLIQVFKHLWNDSWGPRLEYILRNSLLSLLDHPGSTLLDIERLLSDKRFRRQVIGSIGDRRVRDFWQEEYDRYPERFRLEAISPIQNKVGALLSDPQLRRILTAPEKPLRLRQLMDDSMILVVNISKGSIGEDTANLLGSLLISRFDLAALSRTNIAEDQRVDYTVYLDEFHNFTTRSLIFMLSELRKYRLSLVLSHQYLTQLEPPIRDAIQGNVGTTVLFRVGAVDAEFLEPEFGPEVRLRDLTNLPNYHVYIKMMIDGKVSRPFSAVTLPPASIPT